MKVIFAFILALAGFAAAYGQNEQSPIVEKAVTYNNWTYKSVTTGEDTNLRDLAKGKKLMMVVYYAPWCSNWRHDAPMLQRLHDKYKNSGLGIVGVGEYDPVASMKNNLEFMKITFPAVYESEARGDKQKTMHYGYRTATGDTRGWGSPWYIFLEPGKFDAKGDVLATKANIVNGELIEAEGEKLIREKLGLPAEKAAGGSTAKAANVCDPEKPSTAKLKTPAVS
ncbi:MAG: redoxin domain-containing protein [Acidobacteriota bacterium]